MEWMRSWPKGWYSPLHLACKHGHEQIIWTLLEHGAKWNLADKVLIQQRDSYHAQKLTRDFLSSCMDYGIAEQTNTSAVGCASGESLRCLPH